MTACAATAASETGSRSCWRRSIPGRKRWPLSLPRHGRRKRICADALRAKPALDGRSTTAPRARRTYRSPSPTILDPLHRANRLVTAGATGARRYHDKTTRLPPSSPISEVAKEETSRRVMIMGIHIRFGLSRAAIAAVLLLPAVQGLAQTPEPSAGNPAINNTPAPSSGGTVSPSMASPSNEANIPKGSNPEGGSGNLGPGSGATPSSSASETPVRSQTAINQQSSTDESRPAQTATDPNAGMNNRGSGQSSSNVDSMPQGKFTSPPNADAE